MKTRNFYILIAAIFVSLFVFWLTIYAFIILKVDLFQDTKTLTIRGTGIKTEISISIDELKSDKYLQIEDYSFDIVNSFENEYSIIYSGVSLWSILEMENLLNKDPSELTFQFWGRDAYHSPKPLNLSIAQNNPSLVILAYEQNGASLFEEGPLRSVIDDSIMPEGEYSSQYSVQKLTSIVIE